MVLSPESVFSIVGHAHGLREAKGTIVVAETPRDVIDTFASWGFVVTSIASLAEVEQQLEVLQAMQRQDPAVGEEDYLNLLPQPELRPRTAETVFTFVGAAEQAGSGGLYAGWAVALTAAQLVDYLKSVGLEVRGVMSLADVEELRDAMVRVAAEDEPDESAYVNLAEYA